MTEHCVLFKCAFTFFMEFLDIDNPFTREHSFSGKMLIDFACADIILIHAADSV